MKRRREGAKTASIDMADVLILLSHGKEEEAAITNSSPPPQRVFVCKTCGRRFPSFQALGGHRASHKRSRLAGCGQAGFGKPRGHECSVCGLEFAVGQALGGHMRRHRAQHGGPAADIMRSGGKRGLWLDLDLNLPPAEGEAGDCRRKIFELELMDPAAPVVVNCFL